MPAQAKNEKPASRAAGSTRSGAPAATKKASGSKSPGRRPPDALSALRTLLQTLGWQEQLLRFAIAEMEAQNSGGGRS